jgi:hypothetical protein
VALKHIKDSDGNYVRNAKGERQAYSTCDGDSHPDTKQTTYSVSNSLWGGSTKNDATYNPSTGGFSDDSSSGSDSDGGSGCFLTTACVAAAGLSDDCDELTTLRALRARLLATTPGRFLVADYNWRAPRIVAAVEASDNANVVWAETYGTVQRIVALVRAERLDDAVAEYRAMTEGLWSRFVAAASDERRQTTRICRVTSI